MPTSSHARYRSVATIMPLVFLAGLACGRVAPAIESSVVVEEGDSVGRWPLNRAHLPIWRIDAANQRCLTDSVVDAHSIDAVGGAVQLRSGTLAVGNARTHEILLFDPSGNFHRSLGRSGSGPGEFRDIGWVGAFRGDTGIAYDRLSHRLTAFTPTDGVVWSWQVPLPPGADSAALAGVLGSTNDGSVIIYAFKATSVREPGLYSPPTHVYRWHPDSRADSRDLEHLAEAKGPERQREAFFDDGLALFRPLFPRPFLVRPAAGRLLISDPGEFHIRSISLEDSKVRVIRADWPGIVLTDGLVDAEIRKITQRIPNVSRIVLEALRRRAPATLPTVVDMHGDSDGNIWVQTRSAASGEPENWWVLSARGEPRATVEMPAVERIIQINGTTIVAIERGRNDVEVPCSYVLERPATR